MKFNLKWIMFCSYLIAIVPYASAFNPDDFFTFTEKKVPEHLSEASRSVVYLITPGKKTGAGVLVHNDIGLSRIFTNAHILNVSTECAVMLSDDTDKPIFVWGVLIASDSAKDMAILGLKTSSEKTEKLLREMVAKDKVDQLLMHSKISRDLLPLDLHCNREVPKEFLVHDDAILPGVRAYFLGFPLGIGVSLEMKEPVMRSGLVATKPKNGLFFLDAIANHGNSGSPVFIMKIENTGSFFISHPSLIGIVSGFSPDSINYVSEANETISLSRKS